MSSFGAAGWLARRLHNAARLESPDHGNRVMSSKPQLATETEARDVAEAARESEWAGASFVRELFLGRFPLHLIHPYPVTDPEEERRAAPFMERLAEVIRRSDSNIIDRTGELPEEDVQELRQRGAV